MSALNGMVCATPGMAEKILVALLHEDLVYIVHSSYREVRFHDANNLIFCSGVNFMLTCYSGILSSHDDVIQSPHIVIPKRSLTPLIYVI